LCTVAEDLDREFVAVGEVGGIKVVEYCLVLALDEGGMNVDELAFGAEWVHDETFCPVITCVCFQLLFSFVINVSSKK
jgi:hypothetical protein